MDVRDVQASDLKGFDAIVHLAAVSNDPVGDLNPDCTYEINHQATVRLARLAKEAGVERFLFASSCSLYGAAGDAVLDENAAFNPVTPYGESKVLAERDLSQLADDRFSPTYLRNGTAYGVSPRLRGDIVLNALIGGWQHRRLAVRSGMTALWQIFGSSRIPMHEMVKIDYLYGYGANWSAWLDLKILLRTVPYVLARRGM